MGAILAADERIAQAVRAELGRALPVDAHRVKVIVLASIVTLAGPVRNVDQRSTAIRAARRVVGVRAIRDEMHLPGRDLLEKEGQLAHVTEYRLRRRSPEAEDLRVVDHDRVITISNAIDISLRAGVTSSFADIAGASAVTHMFETDRAAGKRSDEEL